MSNSSNLKIYKASAGSGKTYTLALEYIKELITHSNNDNYRHILAVTFTKDATGEMKDRILAELYGLAFNTLDSQGFLHSLQESLREKKIQLSEEEIRNKAKEVLHAILHDYSRLNITTIDSFFQRVLRNLARELGKGSKFNLEMNTKKVLSEAVHATIEKANENRQILDWLTTYIENKLDEGKNWRIEEEIFNFSYCIYNEFFQENEQELRKQLQENPQIFAELKTQQNEVQRACKTFFTNTQTEILRLLDENSLELSDFGRSKTSIDLFRKVAEGDYNPNIGTTIDKCLNDPDAWSASKSKKKAEIANLASSRFIPLLKEVLDNLFVLRTSQMITKNLHQLGLIWDITKEISEQNAENNRFMLSDTSMFLNRMIDNSDAPFIYEKLGAEIRHVMIDEFQDTSRLQWNNFKVLLANILANNDFSLIVGDVKQSIYRWRNGDWRILSNINRELNADIRTLQYNWRSEKNIIEFNNDFFKSAAENLNNLYRLKFENGENSPFLSTYNETDLVQKTNKKEANGLVSIDFIPDKDEDETPYKDLVQQAVLHRLLELKANGIPASRICILTRTNDEIMLLADYLASLTEEYPELDSQHYLNIVSNEAFQLNSSPAIKIIIEALRVIAYLDNPVHRAQLDYFLNCHCPSYSSDFIESIANWKIMPLFELIAHLYRHFHLEQIPGQSSYLFAFYDAVSSYLNDKPADIPTFLTYWNDELHKKAIPSGEGVEGIQAMTIHKSKGLQFHTVMIPFCDWKIAPRPNTTVWCGSKPGFYNLELLPVGYTKTMHETIFSGEYESETIQTWMDNLNVLYVAFTRAECNLIILAHDNPKLQSVDSIAKVSDLLLLNIANQNGNWDNEKRHFELGVLDNRLGNSDKESDNPLKQNPLPYLVSFVSEEFSKTKSIFKQSNKSREFINPEMPSKESYVNHGNVMHKLFEQINTLNDIEKAVDNHISEGLISPMEKADYLQKIHQMIQESKVEDWFSNNYSIYQEVTILTKINDEVVQRRPDRVLINNHSTLIIDFKFGEAHKTHQKQVLEYMNLLRKMGYPGVKGYLWYVEERVVKEVKE